MKKFKVKFYPDNKVCEVEQGATVLSAAISAGIHINSACGGDGVCGRCKVIVLKGDVVSQPTGLITLEEKNKKPPQVSLSEIYRAWISSYKYHGIE
jgi:uncharacterized 2Fe-2S/4Fe-4S cluster protein (DUF4445 family)